MTSVMDMTSVRGASAGIGSTTGTRYLTVDDVALVWHGALVVEIRSDVLAACRVRDARSEDMAGLCVADDLVVHRLRVGSCWRCGMAEHTLRFQCSVQASVLVFGDHVVKALAEVFDLTGRGGSSGVMFKEVRYDRYVSQPMGSVYTMPHLRSVFGGPAAEVPVIDERISAVVDEMIEGLKTVDFTFVAKSDSLAETEPQEVLSESCADLSLVETEVRLDFSGVPISSGTVVVRSGEKLSTFPEGYCYLAVIRQEERVRVVGELGNYPTVDEILDRKDAFVSDMTGLVISVSKGGGLHVEKATVGYPLKRFLADDAMEFEELYGVRVETQTMTVGSSMKFPSYLELLVEGRRVEAFNRLGTSVTLWQLVSLPVEWFRNSVELGEIECHYGPGRLGVVSQGSRPKCGCLTICSFAQAMSAYASGGSRAPLALRCRHAELPHFECNLTLEMRIEGKSDSGLRSEGDWRTRPLVTTTGLQYCGNCECIVKAEGHRDRCRRLKDKDPRLELLGDAMHMLDVKALLALVWWTDAELTVETSKYVSAVGQKRYLQEQTDVVVASTASLHSWGTAFEVRYFGGFRLRYLQWFKEQIGVTGMRDRRVLQLLGDYSLDRVVNVALDCE